MSVGAFTKLRIECRIGKFPTSCTTYRVKIRNILHRSSLVTEEKKA